MPPSKDSGEEKARVVAYIDGFNLYYGICDAGYRRYLWLNIQDMVGRLLRPDQTLVATKYFTTRISGYRPSDRPEYAASRKDKKKRQSTYLDALETLGDFEIKYGKFHEDQIECKKCRATWMDAEEKMTDVNIATEMIFDAFANRYDVAMVVSGDSDLVPPIKAIRSTFSNKRINAVFPPERHSANLRSAANGIIKIGRGTLKKSQFPDTVKSRVGYELVRPQHWTKDWLEANKK